MLVGMLTFAQSDATHAASVHESILLYDNGPLSGNSERCNQGPNGCGITNGGAFTWYDNFQLSEAAVINGFAYYDYFFNNGPESYISTIWSIWGGPPNVGAPIAQGTDVAAVAPHLLGSHRFEVGGITVPLPAGIYWLGISNFVVDGTIITFGSASNSPLPGASYWSETGSTPSTHPAFPDRAFQILAIPEPATAAFSMLALTAAWRRKRLHRTP